MTTIRTYLKSGQVIETVSRASTQSTNGMLTNVEWKDIKSGERVMHIDLEQVAAITEVIETKATK